MHEAAYSMKLHKACSSKACTKYVTAKHVAKHAAKHTATKHAVAKKLTFSKGIHRPA
jgi:hypothetical protein